MNGPPFRIGSGVDVHAFGDDPARPLLLGGVVVPEGPGLAGHSDADVLLHAVTDAVLGAGGLGDLGTLFGTDDPQWAGASSDRFLVEALSRCRTLGWVVGNVDCTIVAARPRVAAYTGAMTDSLAQLLEVEIDRVGIKATTTDGLGWTGRGEGIAALAVALLVR